MSLRNSLVVKIWAAIEGSAFSVADFDVKFDSSSGTLLLIVFRHNEIYKFLVTEKFNNEIISSETPGDYKKTEIYRLSSLANIPERISEWTKNLRDELRTTLPVYSEIDELKIKIDKFVNEQIKEPEQQFTTEEAEELKLKLDELSKKLQEMQEKSEITEKELNKLNQEISSIKVNLGSYPKGIWYKTAANKIWTSFSKIATSKESRQVLAQAARKMIGMDDI